MDKSYSHFFKKEKRFKVLEYSPFRAYIPLKKADLKKDKEFRKFFHINDNLYSLTLFGGNPPMRKNLTNQINCFNIKYDNTIIKSCQI